MPFKGYHSCRLRNPGDFQKDSFRAMKVGNVLRIIGRLKGQTTTTTQAVRYPTSSYTEAEAMPGLVYLHINVVERRPICIDNRDLRVPLANTLDSRVGITFPVASNYCH